MRRQAIVLVFPCILLSILVFSQVHFAVAISWLPIGEGEIRLTTNPSVDIAPSVIQTDDRRIWVVWEQGVQEGRALFYKTSSNYGISWSQESNLTTVPNLDMNQDPSLTQLSNGTIIVVWSALKSPPPEPSFTLNADPLHISIPQGSSDASTIIVTSIGGFSGPVDLKRKLIEPGLITTSLAPVQVTPLPNGNANSTLTISVGALATPKDYHILVTGNSTSLNQTKSVTVTLTVTAMSGSSAEVSDSPASDPIEATQTEGSYDIYYKVSNDDGETWSSDARLVDDPGEDLGPCVVQASNGTIWVFWSSNRMGNYNVYYKVNHNGASWSSDIRLTSDSALDARPAATQTQDGRIWVVWHSNRSGNSEIYYNYYNVSTFSWLTSDFRLTTTATDISDLNPTILQTSDGVMWVFWKSMGSTQPPYIYYKQSLDNGATWSGNVEFTNGWYDEAWPMTTQSCDAKIWVIWSSFRDGNWEIYYKTSLVHNLAVTDVVPSPLQVYQMENVSVGAAVYNFGDFGESFTVNCYANTTLVDSRITALASGSWMNLVLNWNTSGFSRGNYYVAVEVVPVLGEVDTEDNTAIHETVHVKFLGDVNDSGFVNVFDVFSLGKAFGSSPGNPNWNEEADMNGDSTVNSDDLSGLVGNFGHAG